MNKLEPLNKTYKINKPVSLSTGVHENTVDKIDECMNNADSTMYISKTSGKNQINKLTFAMI